MLGRMPSLPPSRRRAFSLVELLVVLGVIALLAAILLPTLSRARRSAAAARCLANLRNLQAAHWMYINEFKGRLIQAGLAHSGAGGDESVAWINTLQRYYDAPLLLRSPGDDSPHWPGGQPVPGSAGQFRRTSYGINNFLDAATCPWGGPYLRINQVPRASATVHFVLMAATGPFAGADHPHVENWVSNIPVQASRQLAIDVYGGPPHSFDSLSNYGFLDGHAETARFGDVFIDLTRNRFDPAIAQ